MQPKRPPPLTVDALPTFPSFLDYTKKKGNLISMTPFIRLTYSTDFRCYVEAFTKFSLCILVNFSGNTVSGPGIRNLWGSIMTQNLPVALASVFDDQLEDLLVR